MSQKAGWEAEWQEGDPQKLWKPDTRTDLSCFQEGVSQGQQTFFSRNFVLYWQGCKILPTFVQLHSLNVQILSFYGFKNTMFGSPGHSLHHLSLFSTPPAVGKARYSSESTKYTQLGAET